jgi:iron complex outermembrane receptor protein
MKIASQITSIPLPDTRRSLYRLFLSGIPIVSLALLIAGLLAPSPVRLYAQELEIEEIIVTARYREESLQQTPLAITAISGTLLEAKNATNIIEIEKFAPNVTIDHLGAGWGPTLAANIRGVGLNDFKAVFEPAVPIYVDDVLFGRPTGAVLDLLDIERVEVLRGPQGTLFGSNAAGGVLRLITRKPTGDGPSSMEVTMGDYDRLDIRGSFEMTLVPDTLFARISASSKRRDGYVDVLDFTCDMIARGTPELAGIGDGLGADGTAGAGLDGMPDAVPVGSLADNLFALGISTSPNGTRNGCKIDELGNEDVESARGILRWIASDDLEFTFAADVTNQDSKGPADYIADTSDVILNVLSNARSNIGNWGVPYDDRFVPSDPFVNYSTFEDPGAIFRPDDPYLFDPANNPPIGDPNAIPQTYAGGIETPNTNEVLHWGVSGTMDWAIGDDLEVKAILAYREFDSYYGRDSDGSPIPLNHTLDRFIDEQFTAEFRVSGRMMDRTDWTAGLFYFDADDFNSNISILHQSVIVPGGDYDRIDDQQAEKLGVFVHTVTDLTDQLTLTAGLRYSDDEKNIVQTRVRRDGVTLQFPPTPQTQSATRVSPLLGLSYQVNDDVMTYATYSQGFRGGGFNPRPATVATVLSFGPEDIESYEIGVKSDLFDRRLRLNATGFFMIYEDLQLTTTVIEANQAASFLPANAGKAHVSGIEIDMQANPFEGLLIDGSFGWLDFQYKDLGSADPAVAEAAGLNPVNQPCLSCRPQRTPEFTAALGAAYRIDRASGSSLTFRGDLSYQSETHFNVNNAPTGMEDGYTVFDARITWDSPNGDWSVSLLGTNLTDELYKVSVLDFTTNLGSLEWGFARPREYGVAIRRQF